MSPISIVKIILSNIIQAYIKMIICHGQEVVCYRNTMFNIIKWINVFHLIIRLGKKSYVDISIEEKTSIYDENLEN